jgi:hypothetical protein
MYQFLSALIETYFAELISRHSYGHIRVFLIGNLLTDPYDAITPRTPVFCFGTVQSYKNFVIFRHLTKNKNIEC